MVETNCPGCGARTSGTFICQYCATLLRPAQDPAAERQALDEYTLLLRRDDVEQRIRILRTGYMPSDPQVLVDAGLSLIPMLDVGTEGEVAGHRLRAIVIKLKLLAASDPKIGIAKQEFEAALERQRKEDRMYGWIAVAVLVLIVGGIGYAIFG